MELTIADFAKPDVLQCASTSAVDALNLTDANDGIAECRAVVRDEDRMATRCLDVCLARPSLVLFFVSHVLGTGNHARRREGNDGAAPCWNIESLPSDETGKNCNGEELGDGHCHHVEAVDQLWRVVPDMLSDVEI